MKKALLFLLIIPSIIKAQSIKETTRDKFTGVEVTETTTEGLAIVMGLPQVKISGAVFHDPKEKVTVYSLRFTFPPSMSVRSLKKNDSRLVLLPVDGDPITLLYSGEYKIYSSSEHMYFYANIGKDELKELQGKKFTDIRTPSHDYKIKSKQQNVISDIAALLLNNTLYSDTPSKGTTSSVADELKKLKDLLDSGALTQDEYDAAKKKLLEK